MEEYIKKQKMRTKIFALLGVVSIAAFVLIWIYGVPFFTPLIIAAVVLFVKAGYASTRTMGYDLYKANGMEDKLSDIDMSSPVYPNAEIYFGSRAFYIAKAGIALAFEDVENLYISSITTYTYGISRTTRELCFHRRSFETDEKTGLQSSAIKDMRTKINKKNIDEIESFVNKLLEVNPNIKRTIPRSKNNVSNKLADTLKMLGIALLVVGIMGAGIAIFLAKMT